VSAFNRISHGRAQLCFERREAKREGWYLAWPAERSALRIDQAWCWKQNAADASDEH
jgi:hypothetical protein